MPINEIKGYTKTLKSGKQVQVRDYRREQNDAQAQVAAATPGRPPMAGKPGMFANGRSIPGIWLNDSRITVDRPTTAQAQKLRKKRGTAKPLVPRTK
jgi:hypothetical protein